MKIMSLMVTTFLMTLTCDQAYANYSGLVKGYFKFYNKAGGYCPNTANCYGTNYRESHYDNVQSIKDVKVYLKHPTTGDIIGQSVTDVNGYYEIVWYSDENVPFTSGHDGVIYTYLQHKDGRFTVKDSDGTFHRLYANIDILSSYTTDVGTLTYGTSSSPNPAANLYNNAWRTWNYALKYSGPMLSDFYGVTIYHSANISGSGLMKWQYPYIIEISSEASLNSYTIAHEMGHVAGGHVYLNDQYVPDYDGFEKYPYTYGGYDGHSINSAEWASAQFNEGYAHFIGAVAQNWYHTTDPYICFNISEGESCPGDGTDISIETNMRARTPSCNSTGANTQYSPVARWEWATLNYIWDLYDTQNEPGIADDVSISYGHLLNFNNTIGTEEMQRDEPYDVGPWPFYNVTIDERDGRSTKDYKKFMEARHNFNSDNIFYNQCSPVGD